MENKMKNNLQEAKPEMTDEELLKYFEDRKDPKILN